MAERKRSRAAEFASSSGGGGEGRFDLAGLFGVGPSINKDFVAGKEGSMPYKTSTIGKVLNPYSARGAEAGNLDYLITQRENADAEKAAEMAGARELDRQIAGRGAELEMTNRQKLDDENRMRANKQATYSKLKPTLTAILQKNGMMDIVLPDSAEEAEMLLGDVMKQQGLGGGYSGMTSQIGKDALTNIENFGRRSIAQTPQGMNDIMSGYGAAARQPQFHQNLATSNLELAERGQTETEAARRTRDIATARQQNLAQMQLQHTMGQPVSLGGGVFGTPNENFAYKLYATTPGREATSSIGQDENGRNRVINTPATRTSVSPLPLGAPSRRGVMTLPADDVTLTTGGNPAPQNAAPPNLGLMTNQSTLSTPLTFNTQRTPTGFTATPRQTVSPQQVEEAKRRLQQLLSQPLY